MAELVRDTLRMNPSRVIVGEVLGDEVVTMLNAMTQGNDGSLSTIHANSSADVVNKIATYAIQAPERLPWEATVRLVASGLGLHRLHPPHPRRGRAAAGRRVGPRDRRGQRGRPARRPTSSGASTRSATSYATGGAGPLPRRPDCCRVAPHERGVVLMSTATLLLAFMVTVGAGRVRAGRARCGWRAGCRASRPGRRRIRPGRLGQAADLRRRRGRRCRCPRS